MIAAHCDSDLTDLLVSQATPIAEDWSLHSESHRDELVPYYQALEMDTVLQKTLQFIDQTIGTSSRR